MRRSIVRITAAALSIRPRRQSLRGAREARRAIRTSRPRSNSLLPRKPVAPARAEMQPQRIVSSLCNSLNASSECCSQKIHVNNDRTKLSSSDSNNIDVMGAKTLVRVPRYCMSPGRRPNLDSLPENANRPITSKEVTAKMINIIDNLKIFQRQAA